MNAVAEWCSESCHVLQSCFYMQVTLILGVGHIQLQCWSTLTEGYLDGGGHVQGSPKCCLEYQWKMLQLTRECF